MAIRGRGSHQRLTEVECLRTLDRLRILEGIPDQALAERRESVYQLLASLVVVEIRRTVLERAAATTPDNLGTLDAIHLATAQLGAKRPAQPDHGHPRRDPGHRRRALGMATVGV